MQWINVLLFFFSIKYAKQRFHLRWISYTLTLIGSWLTKKEAGWPSNLKLLFQTFNDVILAWRQKTQLVSEKVEQVHILHVL